jgi:hypothetical protein
MGPKRSFITVLARRLFWSDFFQSRTVSSRPNIQAGGPPSVGHPGLLIHYIRSYTPYLAAVFPVRNLRTRHAVVTRDSLNMAYFIGQCLLFRPYIYSLQTSSGLCQRIQAIRIEVQVLLFYALSIYFARSCRPGLWCNDVELQRYSCGKMTGKRRHKLKCVTKTAYGHGFRDLNSPANEVQPFTSAIVLGIYYYYLGPVLKAYK